MQMTHIRVFTVKIALHSGLCDSCPHCRCDLAPVSSICKPALISSFWAPNGLNKLLEMSFEFLSTPISKIIHKIKLK